MYAIVAQLVWVVSPVVCVCVCVWVGGEGRGRGCRCLEALLALWKRVDTLYCDSFYPSFLLSFNSPGKQKLW